VYSDFSKLN